MGTGWWVPSTISCGQCFLLLEADLVVCDHSKPQRLDGGKAYGHSPAALLRALLHTCRRAMRSRRSYDPGPTFARDVGPIRISTTGLDDEKVLLPLGHSPTGYQPQRAKEPGTPWPSGGAAPGASFAIPERPHAGG